MLIMNKTISINPDLFKYTSKKSSRKKKKKKKQILKLNLRLVKSNKTKFLENSIYYVICDNNKKIIIRNCCKMKNKK